MMFNSIVVYLLLHALLQIGANSVCPRIKFDSGKIITTDSVDQCTFEIGGPGGTSLKGREIFSVSVYGMVFFDCGSCSSVEASLYTDCQDCAFCLHNEYIDGCRAVALPVILAFLIGLLIILFCLSLTCCVDFPALFAKCCATISLNRQDKRAECRKKKAAKLLKTGIFSNPIQVELESMPLPVTNRPTYPSLYQELKDLQNNDTPLFTNITESKPSCPEYLELNSATDKPLGFQKKPVRPNFNKNAVTTAMTLAILAGRTECCDSTAYVSSSNQLYKDSGMLELYSGMFFMQTGSSICLRYADDKVDRITVVSSWLEDLYTPLYRTASYDLTVETKWNCMGAGYCWSGYCQKVSQHPEWKGTDAIGVITEYGCFQSAAYCDHCTYNKQCVYYKATIKPKQNKYTVYKLTESNWKVSLMITKHTGMIEKMMLSSRIVSGGSDVKVSLLQPSYSKFHYNKFMVQSPEGINWLVDANELGDLSAAKIGDLQIGLYKEDEISYMSTSLDCSPNSCEAQCTLPESGLIRGLKQFRRIFDDTIFFSETESECENQ